MLQPAITIVDSIEHEQVIVKRRFLVAMPKADFRFTNLFCVGQQPGTVKTRQGTRHHKAVRHTGGGKRSAPECSHLDRAIDQLVIVGRPISSKALPVDLLRRQACG